MRIPGSKELSKKWANRSGLGKVQRTDGLGSYQGQRAVRGGDGEAGTANASERDEQKRPGRMQTGATASKPTVTLSDCSSESFDRSVASPAPKRRAEAMVQSRTAPSSSIPLATTHQ